MKDLSHYRKSYEKSALLEQDIPNDPINLFHRWFHEVQDFGGTDEVNAMTVSTQGLDGFPKARVVLLKQYNEQGFVFYTNYESEKGKAIAANPKVCLSFFWNSMERQVIIKGTDTPTFKILKHHLPVWHCRIWRYHYFYLLGNGSKNTG